MESDTPLRVKKKLALGKWGRDVDEGWEGF